VIEERTNADFTIDHDPANEETSFGATPNTVASETSENTEHRV